MEESVVQSDEVVADNFYARNQSWLLPILIILAVQAFLGLIAIEFAFSRLKRMQNDHDEKRDQYYHAFRRTDSKRWSRCKFYPGALFSMPIRMVILILQGILLLLTSK